MKRFSIVLLIAAIIGGFVWASMAWAQDPKPRKTPRQQLRDLVTNINDLHTERSVASSYGTVDVAMRRAMLNGEVRHRLNALLRRIEGDMAEDGFVLTTAWVNDRVDTYNEIVRDSNRAVRALEATDVNEFAVTLSENAVRDVLAAQQVQRERIDESMAFIDWLNRQRNADTRERDANAVALKYAEILRYYTNRRITDSWYHDWMNRLDSATEEQSATDTRALILQYLCHAYPETFLSYRDRS